MFTGAGILISTCSGYTLLKLYDGLQFIVYLIFSIFLPFTMFLFLTGLHWPRAQLLTQILSRISGKGTYPEGNTIGNLLPVELSATILVSWRTAGSRRHRQLQISFWILLLPSRCYEFNKTVTCKFKSIKQCVSNNNNNCTFTV